MSSNLTRILGIETSCDETAVAIVDNQKHIIAQALWSQLEEHMPYQGVVPEIASRAHMERLEGLTAQALADSRLELADVDAIAVTSGPGLIGGVIVGVMFAKAIASVMKKPLIGVNHLEGHALSVRLSVDIEFPYLILLASGGHCQFLLAEGVGRYKKLGGTIDDAMGEAFDKVAKLLNLGFPGGPAVEKAALSGNSKRFDFPKPLCDRKGCDFSFSGLKTSVRNLALSLHEEGKLDDQAKADIAASFQRTVAEITANRLENAIEMAGDVKTLAVAGGVAANLSLRTVMESAAVSHGLVFAAPPLKLCTDNAAMIAWAGIERFHLGLVDDIGIKPRARWPLGG